MIRRQPLGRTGQDIPEIGLGTWNYHGGVEALRAGFEAGALWVDTAEAYQTESVVAEAIAGRRSEIFLATKVSAHHLHRAALLQAADRSLQQLRTDYIDLYQVHEPNDSVPYEETFGALEELLDAGKIRFIGVSNFSIPQVQRAQKALRHHPLVANQVRYNLLDRTIETELLPYCRAAGITVIAYSPLGRDFRRLRDADPQGILSRIASETGRSVAQIVLNWCLEQPGVLAIPRGNTVAHVQDFCGASGWRLEGHHRQLLDQKIRFRRRSRAELWLRRHVPAGLGPWLQRAVNRLPSAWRRHVQ